MRETTVADRQTKRLPARAHITNLMSATVAGLRTVPLGRCATSLAARSPRRAARCRTAAAPFALGALGGAFTTTASAVRHPRPRPGSRSIPSARRAPRVRAPGARRLRSSPRRGRVPPRADGVPPRDRGVVAWEGRGRSGRKAPRILVWRLSEPPAQTTGRFVDHAPTTPRLGRRGSATIIVAPNVARGSRRAWGTPARPRTSPAAPARPATHAFAFATAEDLIGFRRAIHAGWPGCPAGAPRRERRRRRRAPPGRGPAGLRRASGGSAATGASAPAGSGNATDRTGACAAAETRESGATKTRLRAWGERAYTWGANSCRKPTAVREMHTPRSSRSRSTPLTHPRAHPQKRKSLLSLSNPRDPCDPRPRRYGLRPRRRARVVVAFSPNTFLWKLTGCIGRCAGPLVRRGRPPTTPTSASARVFTPGGSRRVAPPLASEGGTSLEPRLTDASPHAKAAYAFCFSAGRVSGTGGRRNAAASTAPAAAFISLRLSGDLLEDRPPSLERIAVLGPSLGLFIRRRAPGSPRRRGTLAPAVAFRGSRQYVRNRPL